MTKATKHAKLVSMKQELSFNIVQAGQFLKLFKNDTLYDRPVIRINKNRKNLQFVIVFKLDQSDTFYLLNRSKNGYSDQLQRIRTFSPSGLYQAMMTVPLRARNSLQILQVPSDGKDIKPYIRYYDDREITSVLGAKKGIPDGVFNPFRDAHSALFHKESRDFDTVPSEDYQGIQDFHPFLTDGDQVLALPASYQDPLRGKSTSLQLMGWYYLDQQLKISWKPVSQGRARWRSSMVAIDKKTRRYFFQGNIYKERGTDPVFIENLQIHWQNFSEKSRADQAEFARFLHAIKEQERAALLKLR